MAVDFWTSIYWIRGLTSAVLLFSFLFFIGEGFVIRKGGQGDKKPFPWRWMAIFVCIGSSLLMVWHYLRYDDTRNYYDQTHETFVARVSSEDVGLEVDGIRILQSRGSGDDARRAYFWQNIEKPKVGSCVEVGFIGWYEGHRGDKDNHYIGVSMIELKSTSCERLSSYNDVKRAGASHKRKAEAYSKN